VIGALAATLIAAAACLLAWAAYPKDLAITTDIVGYPIAYDFNPRPATFGYFLIAVGFPALSIALWSLLEWRARRRDGSAIELLPRTLPEEEPDAGSGDSTASAYLRLAAVGILIATAIAIAVEAPDDWLLVLGLPVTLAYVAMARVAAAGVARVTNRTVSEALAALNATVASFGLLGVAVASESIHVDVESLGHPVAYDIAPFWALLAVAVGVAACVGVFVWRGPAPRAGVVERWAMLVVCLPVFVYLTIAWVSGALAAPDLFHEGERLGGADLVFNEGEFPWRDVLFAHGVYYDSVFPALNTAAIDASRWGQDAAIHLIERPLLWLTTLGVCIYLFRRNWVFLLGSVSLLLFGWFDGLDNTRMMVVPVALLGLAALLARPTWPRAFLLMAVTIVQAVAVPEATFYSAATWFVVVAYELTSRRTPDALPWRESRTVKSAVSGIVVGLGFLVYLAANDAIGGFADYYATFIGNHDLTGAHEITWTDLRFHLWAIIPLVTILAAWLYAAVRIFSGRWFTVADWVVGAAVLGLIPYYLKFLGRPDQGHLFQVAYVAVVPALYVVYRLVQAADSWAARTGRTFLAYRPASLLALLLVLVLAPAYPLTVIGDVPGEFTATAETEPEDGRLGYADPEVDEALYTRIQRVVSEYADGGAVFDFTNSPLLFSYLLETKPSTRFYHVSMAIRSNAQEELVEELEEEKPDLVAYNSSFDGLPNWDGISNTVRHYLVSDYLLDNYRPVERVDDYIFYARDDSREPRPDDLYFAGLPCDWGYAPEFLDQVPADGAEEAEVEVEVALERRGASALVNVGGWAADLEAGKPAQRVLMVQGDRVLGDALVGVPRQDVVANIGPAGILRSGFQASDVVVPADASEPGAVTIYGVSPAGVASPLGAPPNPLPERLMEPDGSEIEVVPGAVAGRVDNFEAVPMERYELALPPDFQSYDWLRLSASGPLGENLYFVNDALAGGGRAIAFRSLARLEHSTEQVRVGACPQWKGYRGPVYLSTVAPSPNLEARLIR
jgi:hypothetical protein